VRVGEHKTIEPVEIDGRTTFTREAAYLIHSLLLGGMAVEDVELDGRVGAAISGKTH